MSAVSQPLCRKRKLSGRQLMCQKQAVKFSHVIHIRSEGGCEEEEEEGAMEERRGGEGGGGRHKGWSDAVAVIKPALTNTSSAAQTEHTLHARIGKAQPADHSHIHSAQKGDFVLSGSAFAKITEPLSFLIQRFRHV